MEVLLMILQQGLGANYINGSDIVASNLSADGTTLLASTFIGGSGNDGLNSTHPIYQLRIERFKI